MATGDLSVLTGITHLNLQYVSHCSEILVDLDALYKFMKNHHQITDKKDIPRRNQIRLEVNRFQKGIIEYDNKQYLTFGTVLRYCFTHSDDFFICQAVVEDTVKTLTKPFEGTPVYNQTKNYNSTLFQLYQQIATTEEVTCIGENTFTDAKLQDSQLSYIESSYKNAFKENEWIKIQLFEFQFSYLEKERRKSEDTIQYLASLLGRKWAFWETIKGTIELGQQLRRLNSIVCRYQRNRLQAAEAIEGVCLEINGIQHLPKILEDIIHQNVSMNDLKCTTDIVVVDCTEKCNHTKGIHVFIEVDENKLDGIEFTDMSVVIITSLKDHVPVQEIIYMKKESLTKIFNNKETDRFSLRDNLLMKRLGEEIVHIDRSASENDDDSLSESHSAQFCSVCYEQHAEWIGYPLSVSSYDYLQEWSLFVPLPVRLLLEKTFLNVKSLRQADNTSQLLFDKIARLTSMYDVGLNTLNQKYFGLSQEMNTAELIVNYHNATSVFGITQASGITMSLASAEKKLKKLANPERCYFRTYLKKYPLLYATVDDISPQIHFLSLRKCHLIFLVDNLVRIQKRSDPEGSNKTLSLCTLPMTVKGLPRDSKITMTWHTEDCDGTQDCSCKDDRVIRKADIDNLLLSNTEEEEILLNQFRHGSVWGLKSLLQRQEVKQMFQDAAERYTPLPAEEENKDTEELAVSFQNISLQELDGQNQKEVEALQQSVTDLSFQSSDVNNLSEIKGTETKSEVFLKTDFSSRLSLTETEIPGHYSLQEEKSSASYLSVEEMGEPEVPRNCHMSSDQVVSNQLSEDVSSNITASSTYGKEGTSSVQNTETGTSENSSFSFNKFHVPPLLCRHPPPAEGKDDDIRKIREILDDVLLKSGYSSHIEGTKEKILLAPDHKIASNVFKLMKEAKYQNLLPEFPILHLIKSKINNLVSAYKPLGFIQILKYMKDDENETDWSKLVTLSEIEGAARNIRRLSLSLHLAIFCTFLESLNSIEADNLLLDLDALPVQEVESRWHAQYEIFVEKASKLNATFCLHVEMMKHCDEIVGIQLAERTGGKTGYTLLLALVKESLPFSFLNGASSYASFCVQLLYEHYKSGFFYQRMKETLFSTHHKDYQTNFGLDAQREMDHRDVVKGFRSSSNIESILPRMLVIDDLHQIQKARQSIYKTSQSNRKTETSSISSSITIFGKDVTEKDVKFINRCAQMVLRCGALKTSPEQNPRNAYVVKTRPLTECILDRETLDVGKFLIKKFICKAGLAGTTEIDCPSVDEVVGPQDLIKKVKVGKGTTVQRGRCKPTGPKSEKDVIEEKRQKEIKKLNKLSKHCTSIMNTCQAIVNPDCSKTDTPKSKGIRDAILLALMHKNEKDNLPPRETIASARKRRTTALEEEGMIFLQTDEFPANAKADIKIVIVEFAGVKFKSFATTGEEFMGFVKNTIFHPVFRDFTNTQHIVVCEEKYSFTPDVFKALTREKRQKEENFDICHLKSKEEMLSMSSYSKGALTRTDVGKKLVSSFLAEHVENLKICRNLILDIDSEYILSQCTCKDHRLHPCKQYAVPVRAVFEEDGAKVTRSELQDVKQRKGEAEMSQVDWLPYVVPELDEEDAVLSYVTSGDIDSLPIHILAISMYWPRLPNGKFKHAVYLLLKKPQRDLKPDVFCVTKIVEKLEEDYGNKDIAIITGLCICLGGNDFTLNFMESHTKNGSL